jgi:hypothetical protein
MMEIFRLAEDLLALQEGLCNKQVFIPVLRFPHLLCRRASNASSNPLVTPKYKNEIKLNVTLEPATKGQM